ncbi:MAG: leucine-rich repeat protein [Eubacteriales bacterium]|nr:leucine-rich repeat protein [Eubacteriales bacterium]
MKKVLCFIMALVMLISIMSGLNLSVLANTGNGDNSSDIDYTETLQETNSNLGVLNIDEEKNVSVGSEADSYLTFTPNYDGYYLFNFSNFTDDVNVSLFDGDNQLKSEYFYVEYAIFGYGSGVIGESLTAGKTYKLVLNGVYCDVDLCVNVTKPDLSNISGIELTNPDQQIVQYQNGWWKSGYENSYYYSTYYILQNTELFINYSDGTSSVINLGEYEGDGALYNGIPIYVFDNQTDDYEWTTESSNNIITFSYAGFSENINVTVVESPISRIEASTSVKFIENSGGYLTYDYQGPNFEECEYYCYNTQNIPLTITAYYNDGTSKTFDIRSGDEYDGYYVDTCSNQSSNNPWCIGNDNMEIEVSYLGKTDTVKADMVSNPIVDFDIIQKPCAVSENVEGTLISDYYSVVVYYTDGTSEAMDIAGFPISYDNFEDSGDFTVDYCVSSKKYVFTVSISVNTNNDEYIVNNNDTVTFNINGIEKTTQFLKEGETHTHIYTNIVTAPTCTEQGYTTYICLECGYSYIDNYVNPTGHYFGTDDNSEFCSICGIDNPNYEPPIPPSNPDDIVTGVCGADGYDVKYSFDKANQSLKIFGTGEMKDYSSASKVPWYKDRASIKTVKIEDGVTKIGNNAFADCNSLTRINISDTVTSIGKYAFKNTALTSLVLPKNIENLGYEILQGNTGVTEITIPKTLKNADFQIVKDYPGPFGGSAIKKAVLEKGLVSIPGALFSYCTELEEVIIPDTVTSIKVNSTSGAFMGCVSLSKISLPDTITAIGDYAFKNSGLVNVTLPDSITTMGEGSFCNCQNLKYIKLPNTRQNISKQMFYGCTSLESITLPDTVKYIRESAFENSGLKSIKLTSNVELIEANAFKGSALESISFSGKETSIGNNAFQNCDSLTSIAIPDSVSTIGAYMFQDCDALTDVKLGTGITKIPSYAFEHCDMLKKIVIPYRVTSIAEHSFANCVTLTEIRIPRATTSIDSTAFSYPEKMTIKGVSGTYAEAFANAQGIKFINDEVKATAVSLNNTKLSLNNGQTAKLVMSVTPTVFTDEVTWKSTNTNIATVDNTGLVTAKGVGSATIKLTVGNVSASCSVTVLQLVTSISLNRTSLMLNALDTFELRATVYPADANNKNVAWSSSNESVATVDDNGVVTAHSKGNAVITVASQDGSNISKSCNVTVSNNAYVVSDVSGLESPHNYLNNCSDFWIYTDKNAQNLEVTFDSRTNVEESFDYIYIYDSQNNEIGKYTGTELAGKTVELSGNTVKIKLVSDNAGEEWGFKVTDVKAVEEQHHIHKWSNIVTEPTCTEGGYTTRACFECGESYVDDYTSALGHSFTSYFNNYDATCTSDGTKTARCDRCSATDTVIIPNSKLNHKYFGLIVSPTCTEGGYTKYTCSYCGNSYIGNYANATGHNFLFNGANCLYCGCSNPNYTPVTQQPQPQTEPTAVQTNNITVTSTATVKKPKKTEISKLKSAKKAFAVTVKKATDINGYQVEYSTDKKFKKGVKSANIKSNKTSTTVKNLKSKKTYYVRVRTYKSVKVNGKTTKVYSAWSKVKSVKTK